MTIKEIELMNAQDRIATFRAIRKGLDGNLKRIGNTYYGYKNGKRIKVVTFQ